MAATALPLHPELEPLAPTRPDGPRESARVPLGQITFDQSGRVKAANQDAIFLLQSRHLPGLTLEQLFEHHGAERWDGPEGRDAPFSLCRRLRLRDGVQPCVLYCSIQGGDWVVRFQPADELAFLDYINDAAGLVDERGLIVSVNEHFVQQFGVDGKSVIGQSAIDVLHRFYPSPSFTTHLLDLVLAGEPWSETPHLLLADGRRHVLRVRLVPWRYGGCVCGIVWLASDATDVAEGAQQRTAALMYRIMATLQHELRNPLQTMQAAVDVLRPQVGLPGQRYLDVLGEHIRLIDAELSDQMLFGVQSQTVFVPGRLSEVVAREIERASLRARTAGLSLVHEPPRDEPTIQLHPGSLGRVFANLFRNAAQARPDATVEVAYHIDRHGISCSVSDNGPGFPDHGRSAEGTWLGSGDAPGSRLGLAIVASTVEAHGGTVTLGNRAGGGAHVLLRLPLPQERGAPVPSAPQPGPVQRESPAFALRRR